MRPYSCAMACGSDVRQESINDAEAVDAVVEN